MRMRIRSDRSTDAERRRHARPAVERLEGRSLPSGFTSRFALGVVSTGASVTNGLVDVEADGVATDASGNVFMTGSLAGRANFTTGANSLASGPARDVFLAKYSATGALLWVKDLPGADSTSVAQGSAAAVDASGDVVITGTFTGTVDFDPGAGTKSFSAPLRNDVFVAKYDPNGNLLWAVDMPATSGSAGAGDSVAVDASGNIAVAGSYSGSVAFGGTTLTATGLSEAFVAKLGPTGSVLWAATTTGSGASQATSAGVAFDASGDVVDTGSFSGTVDFDPSSGATTLTSAGSRDAFVRKLDPAGKLLWADGFGSPDIDQGNGITVDASGNLYVAGTFSDTVDFDPGPATHNLSAAGLEDGFLLKLNAQGGYGWAVDLASATGGAVAAGVGVTSSGGIIVAGDFWGALAPDPANPSTTFPSVAGSFDAFVASYDPNGLYQTGTTFGGVDFDAASAVGVGPAGEVAVIGRYSDAPAVLGTTLPNATTRGAFLAGFTAGTPAPPVAPAAPVLEAASDTGLSASDGITRATSPVFDVSGVTSATNVVTLYRDGIAVSQRTGAGAVADPGPVSDGLHSYKVTQTDAYGQLSPVSGSIPVTIDTQAPAAPAAPALDPLDDSGTAGDGITNVNKPRLVGTATAGVLLQILDASGNVVASAMTAADGSYTVALPGPLADGTFAFRARAEDVAGNFSAAGPALTLVIDTTPPATPAAPALLAADDSGAAGDGLTNVSKPRLTGTVEANATVRLLDASGNVLGTGAAGSDGRYTAQVASVLKDGTYLVRAQATDAAGNTGSPGPAFTLTIDTTPPARPAAPALLAADDSGILGDGITSVTAPRFTGTAEAGATVELLDPKGTILGKTTATGQGGYTVAPSLPLANGSYSLTVVAIDAAGNASAASPAFTLVIDTTAPARPSAPALLASDDSGTVGDGITNVTAPRFSGTAEAGSAVALLDAKGNVLGKTTATGQGGYTVAPTQPLADGSYSLTVVSTDAAGNASAASPATSLTVLTTPPAKPTSLALLALDDSGTPGDNLTNVTRPRLTGAATPGLTVLLVNGAGATLGTATVGGDGTYTVQPATALADGTYALQTKLRDVAGNVGAAGPLLTLTIKATPPAAPAAPALFAADDSAPVGDGKTSVRQPRLVGTTAAGAAVDLLNAAGAVVATTTASSTGAYTLQPPANLAVGATSFAVRIHDAAGNVSAASASLKLTIVDVTPGDFDGDGKTDLAIFRPSTAQWIVRPSGGGASTTTVFGAFNLADIPVPGDYDGTGHEEYAVFRPATSQWIIKGPNGTHTITFGAPNLGDIPVPGDYDGVGHTEPAIFRPSTAQWYVYGPNGSHLLTTFGATGLSDVPAPGDYDGVGYTEPAIFRPSTSQWIVKSPTGSKILAAYGAPNLSDVPVDGPAASLVALKLIGGGIRMSSFESPSAITAVPARVAASDTSAAVIAALDAWILRIRPNQ